MKSLCHALAEYFKNLPQKSKIEIFCVGCMIGLIASWVYIIAGGDTWLFIPQWAEVIFFPGFFVGYSCYQIFGSNIYLGLIFGSLTVGLFYGTLFVVLMTIWNLLSRMGKRVVAMLCIITILIGIVFWVHLTMIDRSGEKRFRQNFTLSITSNPPGAKIYPLKRNRILPDSIGTTPMEFKGSYSVDRDGSGWGTVGTEITLKSTDEAYLIHLNCVVLHDEYSIREIGPVLATIPKKNAKSDQMPSDFKYHAELVPIESNQTKKVGTAIMIDGCLIHVNPASLNVMDGVYVIDIRKTK